MLAFGLAGFRAGRLDSWINDFGMALRRDLFLCHQHFTAGRAVLAFGLAWLRAGRFDGRIDHFSMALCRDLFLRYQHLTADGTVFAFGFAGLRAGRLDSRVDHCIGMRAINDRYGFTGHIISCICCFDC